MRRTILIVAIVPFVLGLVALPASAGWGPPIPYDWSDASNKWCGFRVQLETSGGAIVHEWVDASGNYHYVSNATGLQLTATNLKTGKSITVMNNGSENYSEDPAGAFTYQIAGPWVFTADPSTFLEEPGLFYSTGRILWTGYEPLTYTHDGPIVDLCPLLK